MSDDAPVSVKAALRCGDMWVLLRNERNEWELPGGRIDTDDRSLRDVVRRECREELALDVEVGDLLDSWLFEVLLGRRVVIVCFAAVAPDGARPVISDEHNGVGLFAIDQIDRIALPEGYARAIHLAAERMARE